MIFYKYSKRLAAFACLFSILLIVFAYPVFADDAPEDPYLILTPEDVKEAAENMMVGTLQERLAELGYYTERVTLIFDATTRFALYNFCLTNELPFDEGGVRQSIWDALMSEDALPAGRLAEYAFIPYGTVSDTVLALQTRLKELQYYEGLVLVPEVYDEDLQTAVDRFCEINAVSYDRSGITPAVQELIYSSGALPYTAPEEQRSSAEKFADYMMRDADLLVIVVPVFVVWILILFLALIVAFVVIRLLKRRKAKREAEAGLHTVKEGKASRGQNNVPPPLPEKQNIVQLQIDYRGKTWNVKDDASHPLTIGRGTADIQLDPSDQGIDPKHCILFFKGAVLMLQDKSDKGTYAECGKHRRTGAHCF